MTTLLEKITEVKNNKNEIWANDIEESIPIFMTSLEKYVLEQAKGGFYNAEFGLSKGISAGLKKLVGSEQEYVKNLFLDRIELELSKDFFKGLEITLDRKSKTDSWGSVYILARF